MPLYPIGYGTRLVTLTELVAAHAPKMHPEFARRLFPYLEHKAGVLGIGGGWRLDPAPGGAPLGKSFHMTQQFASGVAGYCAVDLVCPDPGKVHRAPAWADTDDAPEWGLHTFIMSPPEPWHLQPIEIRGWQSWVNAGRPDPVAGIPLPSDPPPPDPEPEPEPEPEEPMPVFWKDSRYHDTFQTSPCVHYADSTDVPTGTVIAVGNHRRKLRSLATQCGLATVSALDWTKVPVGQIPDEPN